VDRLTSSRPGPGDTAGEVVPAASEAPLSGGPASGGGVPAPDNGIDGRAPGGEAASGDTVPDRSTRQAALWATLIAAPLTLLLVFLAVNQFRPDEEPARTSAPPATAIRPQSTGPVAMPAPALAERPATVCRALLSRLPAAIRDLPQRPVTAGPEQNAAYGDPALTLACGVPPVPVPAAEGLWVVNRVCWQVTERPDVVELTTVDREVPVRVTVPRAYQPALPWVAPLADPVLSSVKAAGQTPTGCRS
jgi:hypothetical protein